MHTTPDTTNPPSPIGEASPSVTPATRRIPFRRFLRWIIVLLVVGFGVYWLKFRPTPVTAHTVALGDVRAEVMGTGTLEARIRTTISPRIQERLAEVLVDQGDSVRSGQLLARLDDSETGQQVAVADATLAAARATVERVRADEGRAQAVLNQARQNHQRSVELLAGQIASQADFDKSAEGLRVAEADLQRSQAAIAEAQSQVSTAEQNLLFRREQMAFTEIRSPYEGLVTRRDRDPGGIVVPGSAIMQLVATNEIWVSAWVDETAMGGLRVGQPGRIVFRSEPTRSFAGEVARLGREADRETREFVVDVRVEELPENWIIGQRAEVFIEAGRTTNVVLIPTPFVHRDGNRAGVFIHDHGRARWRDVTLGMGGSLNREVKKGLAAGEQIVRSIEGHRQPLTDGRRIAVQ